MKKLSDIFPITKTTKDRCNWAVIKYSIKIYLTPLMAFLIIVIMSASVINTNITTVNLRMDNSKVAVAYYSYYEFNHVLDTGRIQVIFNKNNPEYLKAYKTYADRIIREKDNPDVPLLVQDVANRAVDILEAYENADLLMPGVVKIYLTNGKRDRLNTLTGSVSLSTKFINQANPEQILIRSLGHELFHSAQRATMGLVDYTITMFQDCSFWMEATADYMGNTGVFELIGSEPINKYAYYNMDFFKESLFTVNNSHEYDESHFVLHLQNNNKISPRQLIDIAGIRSSFPQTFRAVYGKEANLKEDYHDFIEYSLFNNRSLLTLKGNNDICKSLDRMGQKIELSSLSNKSNSMLSSTNEGEIKLSFRGEYTSDFYIFSTDGPTNLMLKPEIDIVVYRLWYDDENRGYGVKMEAEAEQLTSIDFNAHHLVVVVSVSEEPGEKSIQYKVKSSR